MYTDSNKQTYTDRLSKIKETIVWPQDMMNCDQRERLNMYELQFDHRLRTEVEALWCIGNGS